MTDSRPVGAPQAKPRPWRRLKQIGTYYGLGPSVAIAAAGVRYERVPVFGNAVLTVRVKTATAGGTIDIVFCGPDAVQDSGDVAYASVSGTKYATGNPTQVAVAAGTEAIIQAPCFGDGFAYIIFTGDGTGTITYCDVALADAPVLIEGLTVTSAENIAQVGGVAVGAASAPVPATVAVPTSDPMAAPGAGHAAVTKSDLTVLVGTRALYVGGTGDLVATVGGVDATYVGVPAGTILPIRATKVKAATTATSIVAIT